MEQGYKLRIYPTAAQEILIAKTLGCCRYVWNHCLDLRKELYAKEKKTFNLRQKVPDFAEDLYAQPCFL